MQRGMEGWSESLVERERKRCSSPFSGANLGEGGAYTAQKQLLHSSIAVLFSLSLFSTLASLFQSEAL